jgi:hypothetical protein
MFSDQSRIKRQYSFPENSIYTHRFINDLASGYSFTLSKKGENRDFFTFEPNECKIKELLKGHYHYYSSYDIEQIVSRIAYSLMAYGKAYFYIHPEYSIKKADDGTTTQILSSFEIGEIMGFIKKKSKEEIVFCRKGFSFEVEEIQMSKKQLVIMDIRELGFSKKYFPSVLKKLSKCDITAKSTDMITNHSDVYDFMYHSESKKLAELRATRKIGWSFGTDKLSNSYIMYKKIQEDELRLRFLEYIVKKINDGLHEFLGDDSGELVAHIKRKEYRQLWNDYTEGKITGTELTALLFSN